MTLMNIKFYLRLPSILLLLCFWG